MASARTEPTPSVLRHEGIPCGRRFYCWRDACRQEFGRYRTIEVLRNGDVLARCHHVRRRLHEVPPWSAWAEVMT